MLRRAVDILGHPLCLVGFLALTAVMLGVGVEHHRGLRRVLVYPGVAGGPVARGMAGSSELTFSFVYRAPDGSLMLSADDGLEAWPGFEGHEPLGMIRIVRDEGALRRIEYPEGLAEEARGEARRLLADAHFTHEVYGTADTREVRARFEEAGEFESPRASRGGAASGHSAARALMVVVLVVSCAGVVVSFACLARRRFRGVVALCGSPLTLLACVVLLWVDWQDLREAHPWRIDTTVGGWADSLRPSSARVDPHVEDLVVFERPDGTFFATSLWDTRAAGWRPDVEETGRGRVVVWARQLATGFHAGVRHEMRIGFHGPYMARGVRRADGRAAAMAYYRAHFDDGALITDADIARGRKDAAAAGAGGAGADTVLRYSLGARPLGYLQDGGAVTLVVVLCVSLALVPRRVVGWIRQSRRSRAGHCAACGYDLSGLARGARCPECGADGGTTERRSGGG